MTQAKMRVGPLAAREPEALSVEQLEMLAALEAYDLWFVAERLERKKLVPVALVDEAIVEFKKYMALVGLGYRGMGMTSPIVDEVWHAAVLFTRQYAAFCDDVFGQFIHHSPETSRSRLAPDAGDRLAEAYQAVFGQMPALWQAQHAPTPAGVEAGSCSYCDSD